MPMLTLAHSPDADDLVMWWPLVGLDGREPAIDTGPFSFACVARDVQDLNRRAIETGEFDITAISAATYPLVAERYRITASGGSFGEGYGPKLVARAGADPLTPRTDATLRVAVPGLNTTAYLVLSIMLGRGAIRPVEMPFSEVARAVMDGQCDAGLLIHEAQLTCDSLGLVAVADLGVWWHEHTRLPLPLGLNVLRRDLDERFGLGATKTITRVLAASIRHAANHPSESRAFLLRHADDRPEWRDAALLDRYLRMYVSDLTMDMGDRGREALERLYREANRAGLFAHIPDIDPA
jgi:1,4-dihydroxy-6-naphthoate synthase